MDRYFTWVPLAIWGLEKKFTIVGTMRQDRKGIPKEMKSLQGREEKRMVYAFHKEKDVMMLSYIDKKKSGEKLFVCLQCMTK